MATSASVGFSPLMRLAPTSNSNRLLQVIPDGRAFDGLAKTLKLEIEPPSRIREDLQPHTQCFPT